MIDGARRADELDVRLLAWFAGSPPVTVAFSGGVDSTLVLAAAARALGPDAVAAVTAVSPAVPADAVEQATALADQIGVVLHVVRTDELAVPGYRANGNDRCYFCKSTLIDTVTERLGGGRLVTGTNADDVRAGWRPGMRAARERGAGTPLADTEMTKADVRELSRHWGLPTAEQPASPCLSSRVAYGIEITPARLARVDRGERAVRRLATAAGIDLYNLRVRDLGDQARVEVDDAMVQPIRAMGGLVEALMGCGFAGMASVTEFRSGALNDGLPAELRHR